jgi:hypothetical protein
VALRCRWDFVQVGSPEVVVVVALRLPLYAVPALVVAMLIADVVTGGSGRLRLLDMHLWEA